MSPGKYQMSMKLNELERGQTVEILGGKIARLGDADKNSRLRWVWLATTNGKPEFVKSFIDVAQIVSAFNGIKFVPVELSSSSDKYRRAQLHLMASGY